MGRIGRGSATVPPLLLAEAWRPPIHYEGLAKILELRQHAQEVLGKKFSIRAFHDELLKDGVLPLEILEKQMEAWVAARR